VTDLAVLAERVLPVLAFLIAITVVAEICDLAGVFDEAAHLAARVARGRVVVLWLLIVLRASTILAYLALEVTADHSPVRLAALLIGVNAGPLVTVWGSLATILWAQRCGAAGVTVSWRRLGVTGLLCAVVVVTGSARRPRRDRMSERVWSGLVRPGRG
jgi:Na+/H+ antiporter NhaD/arsenite permease-like protein